MAATADISLNNNAAVAKTFTPTVQVKDGYEYRETSSLAASPTTLRVTHVIALPASNSNTKAGVRFQAVALNAAAQVRTAYIDVTVSVPKDGVTATQVSDLGAYVRNFLTDARISELILGKY